IQIGQAESAQRHERRARIAALLSEGRDRLNAKRAAAAVAPRQESLDLAVASSESNLQQEASSLLDKAKRAEVLQHLHALADKV
ncbi:hypothetical protein N4G37_14240, partial [Enterococcus faecalis]|uniref:hypothetical protein n=1 Tax=Enterococcus faecalis TaxID=1351 RepID=UPI0021B12BB4